MGRALVGDIGHLLVVVAFVTSLAATYGYYRASQEKAGENSWLLYGRRVFYFHLLSVVGVVVALFVIIYNHYFEYHYAYSHSSLNLPTHYMISCFWEGQEGSFLLWIFWNAILGVLLLNINKSWEAPFLTIFAAVQTFLTSMILGIVLPVLNIKIGSDPFILLRDAVQAPIFELNPEFVPADGTGLNPLLQNYWMVIHPPTLFLGFAATLIPFSFCISGLWKRKYKEWITPALPWTLFAAMVLGVGILMGGYWAYETLNFGGYWNWDPVENAVYVPWLILVASYHTMITYRNSSTALRTSIVLVISTFVLILYSTFLTRSGILGDASVHSFTDLGLSGQLLIYLLTFTLLAVVLAARRWKQIPSDGKEISSYSREFWIFIGAATLCLMGFQVLVPTSIPVYNSIMESLGFESNLAPPANQIEFYTRFQLWFGVAVAFLSGTGQFFWWKRMDPAALKNAITAPIIVTLVGSSLIIAFSSISKLSFLVLLTVGIYSIVANGFILFKILKGNVKISGGSVAHIGIAMILIGILFSSGFSKVISINHSGLRLFENASENMDRENVLLWLQEPRKMSNYELLYKGPRIELKEAPGYFDPDLFLKTRNPNLVVANEDITRNNSVLYQKGDTIEIYPENTFYEVEYNSGNGKKFSLYPRAQINPQMGGLLASPDIKKYLTKDLYTHVSAVPDPSEELEWSDLVESKIQIGQQFFVNDFVAILEGVQRIDDVPGVELSPEDVAIKAAIAVQGKARSHILEPIYLIKDRTVGRIHDDSRELGIRLTLMNVIPEENSFVIGAETTQKDYIVLKAIEKPLINILWSGTLILIFGFILAINRRYKDFKDSLE